MVTTETIDSHRQRLYESTSLRDDLNDDAATVLLRWGEEQVQALGQRIDNEEQFEQQARFLRQLMKQINRFVGQREFNDHAGQQKYMDKITMWLSKLELDLQQVTGDALFAALPDDAADLVGNVQAIINRLTPLAEPEATSTPDTPAASSDTTATDHTTAPEGTPDNSLFNAIGTTNAPPLEKTDPNSINVGGYITEDSETSSIGEQADHEQKD